MKHLQHSNAVPKILAFIQGEPPQKIILFIPEFNANWKDRMSHFHDATFLVEKKQWIIPYSSSNITALEKTFREDILFAFKVGKHLGEHKTDL